MNKNIILGEIKTVNGEHRYYIIIESTKSFNELDFNNINQNDLYYVVPIYRDDFIKKITNYEKIKRTGKEIELKNPIKIINFPYSCRRKKYKITFEITKLIEVIS